MPSQLLPLGQQMTDLLLLKPKQVDELGQQKLGGKLPEHCDMPAMPPHVACRRRRPPAAMDVSRAWRGWDKAIADGSIEARRQAVTIRLDVDLAMAGGIGRSAGQNAGCTRGGKYNGGYPQRTTARDAGIWWTEKGMDKEKIGVKGLARS